MGQTLDFNGPRPGATGTYCLTVAVIGFSGAVARKIRLSRPIRHIASLILPDRLMAVALHGSKPNDRVIRFTDSGYIDVDIKNSNFENWKPILERWANSVVSFTDEWDEEDSLHWYNERSTTSSLAGAFWAEGHYAIEEMSCGKQDRKKGKWSGRCDLWATIEDESYWIESKQLWQSAGPNAYQAIERIIEKINQAREDARKHLDDGDEKAIGIVFVSLILTEQQIKDRQKLQKAAVNQLKEKIGYDLMAAAFPASNKVISYNGQLYFGCILFGLSVHSKKLQ